MALLTRAYPFKSLVLPTALLFAGLSGAMAQDNTTIATAPEAAVPAPMPNPLSPPQSADWRNEIGTFKIGLVRGWSSDMSRLALGRVETTFSKALGIPVRVVVFERFSSLMDAQADGRIDLAAYSARAFATIRLMCECVEALASPTTTNGDQGQIAMIVGDATRLASFSDMTSIKLGRIATAGTAGRDMVRGALIAGGQRVSGNETYWVDYADVAAAVAAYQNNEIDGLVVPAAASFENRDKAGSVELDRLTAISSAAGRPLSVIWRSSYWPYGPVAVRINLASEAKSIILQTLEQIDVSAPLAHATLSEGLTGPFRTVEMARFSAVSEAIRTLVSQNANWRP